MQLKTFQQQTNYQFADQFKLLAVQKFPFYMKNYKQFWQC